MLGSSLETIGQAAFFQCTALTNIVIPDIVTVLVENCFAYSGISTITLGSGLSTIGKLAFKECPLDTIDIPHGVTELGDSCFASCQSLKTINIPQSVSRRLVICAFITPGSVMYM